MQRLKFALKFVAKRIECEKKYAKNKEMQSANKAAVALFANPNPVFRRIEPNEPPQNITFLALCKVNLYCIRRGISWRLSNWEFLLEWLYENWDKILRVLLTLLPLVLI